MAVTIFASGSQTCVNATEHTLTSNPETTAGVYQVFLDLDDMTSGEELQVRIKEKARNSSGTQRVVWYDVKKNVAGVEKIWLSPMFMLINGWDVSIEAVGTPVIPWSIRTG